MAEKETVFSSKIVYKGVFDFKEFYLFCYNWLTGETGLDVMETKYEEKITGESKEVEIKWMGTKELTDYFKYEAEIITIIRGMTKVEVNQGGVKVDANKGRLEIKFKGILVRDYKGKFETTAFKKFLRGIYEKWVITSRIEELQGKVVTESDEFLSQAKAYLDMEGRKG
ncbi:MAG: hypothetical protein AABX28_02430 [Nanoarchaeota archaeon]